MADRKTRGIVSPWASSSSSPPTEGGEEGATADKGRFLKEVDEPITPHPRAPVLLRGRHCALQANVLLGDGPSKDVLLQDQIGRMLAELFTRFPACVRCFERQSITLQAPLASKVTLTFGGLVLYARAATPVLKDAAEMAIDRTVTALTECVAKHPDAKKVMAAHQVQMVRLS